LKYFYNIDRIESRPATAQLSISQKIGLVMASDNVYELE
jgi:hypothetical protein